MRMFADTEVQARLMREMPGVEIYEKRAQLEARIPAVDAKRNVRIEEEALVDIAASRNFLSCPEPL